MRSGISMTVGLVLAMAGGAAAAQTVAQPTAPASRGVVKPGSMVDPGMKVIHPKAPPVGMPVIKPRTTTPDGSVVVPK